MNTVSFREKLIDEVKKYPVLYDTKHDNHRDIDERDRCWQEIAARLGADTEHLKREWKILRDSMRQALKRSRDGATTKAGEPCKKWRFQNRMAFILPYVTVRSRRREVRAGNAGNAGNAGIKTDGGERGEGEESEAEPARDELWEPGEEQDALELFFASVCQSAKRLPRKYQASVKRQILDVLLRVEEEYEADDETKEGIV